jgi:hypothetical protein
VNRQHERSLEVLLDIILEQLISELIFCIKPSSLEQGDLREDTTCCIDFLAVTKHPDCYLLNAVGIIGETHQNIADVYILFRVFGNTAALEAHFRGSWERASMALG